MRTGVRAHPFIFGGHQENGRRGGTENIPYIVALARACELAKTRFSDNERLATLHQRLEEGLLKIPYAVINGAGAQRLSTTTNVAFHGIEGEGILYQLDLAGICASSGSACTSGTLEASHVLRALHVPFTAVHGSVRFSMSHETSDADIDRVIEVMPQIVANLRKLSPYWDMERNCPKGEHFLQQA
jgi:cysteine desulfurase